MSLPPLPEPFMELHREISPVVYSAWEKQVRDYGQKCRDAALEEAARLIDENAEGCSWVTHSILTSNADDIRALIGQAAAQAPESATPEWTSAFDRLPEPGSRVIYYFEPVGVNAGFFESGTCQADALFSSRRGFLTGDVTHWMPLPEPPLSAESRARLHGEAHVEEPDHGD